MCVWQAVWTNGPFSENCLQVEEGGERTKPPFQPLQPRSVCREHHPHSNPPPSPPPSPRELRPESSGAGNKLPNTFKCKTFNLPPGFVCVCLTTFQSPAVTADYVLSHHLAIKCIDMSMIFMGHNYGNVLCTVLGFYLAV